MKLERRSSLEVIQSNLSETERQQNQKKQLRKNLEQVHAEIFLPALCVIILFFGGSFLLKNIYFWTIFVGVFAILLGLFVFSWKKELDFSQLQIIIMLMALNCTILALYLCQQITTTDNYLSTTFPLICIGIAFCLPKLYLLYMQIHIVFIIAVEVPLIIAFFFVVNKSAIQKYDITGYIFIVLLEAFFLFFIYFEQKKNDFLIDYLLSLSKSTHNFKNLLNQFIPNPIIIARKEHDSQFVLLWSNEATQKVFGIKKAEAPSERMPIGERFSLLGAESPTLNQKKKCSLLRELMDIEIKEKNVFEEFCADKESENYSMHSGSDKTLREYLVDIKEIGKNQFLNLTGKKETQVGQQTKQLWFDLKIAFIEWEIEQAWIFCLNDIGSQKEVDEYKNKVFATVSHNLRTPLTNILGKLIGNLEVAIKEIREQAVKSQLKSAYYSTQCLNNSVNDIIDFAKITIGDFKLDKKECSIKEIIKEPLKFAKIMSKKKGIQFNQKKYIDENLEIRTDKERIQQILFNLLSNAFKFTSEGAVSFMIKLDNTDPNLQISQKLATNVYQLKIKVKDTGIGIKAENLPQLFKLNPQKSFKNLNIQGVGFGLTISQLLAKQLTEENSTERNGILVKSIQNKGSSFSFFLKLHNQGNKNLQLEEFAEARKPVYIFDSKFIVKEEVSVSTEILLSRINSQNSVKGIKEGGSRRTVSLELRETQSSNMQSTISIYAQKRVIIVDDEAFCLDIITKFVKLMGILQIKHATNGLEALKIVKEQAAKKIYFDCIVLDCNMPVMDGFETAKEIRKMGEENTIPFVDIVALTANVGTADEESCTAAGMNHQLTKPVAQNIFSNKLKSIFNNQKIIDVIEELPMKLQALNFEDCILGSESNMVPSIHQETNK